MEQGFQIGAVSKQTGVTVDAIRFYERERLLKRPERSEGGFRLFCSRDVERIRFIRRAQELGFSLSEIRELLVLRSDNLAACSHVRDLLQSKLAAVRGKILQLRKLEAQLAADFKKCDRTLRCAAEAGHKCCPVLDEIARPNRVRAGRRR